MGLDQFKADLLEGHGMQMQVGSSSVGLRGLSKERVEAREGEQYGEARMSGRRNLDVA